MVQPRSRGSRRRICGVSWVCCRALAGLSRVALGAVSQTRALPSLARVHVLGSLPPSRKRERPFSRAPLEQHLVARIRGSIAAGQTCLVVGGPGGIGKSVFWEALLAKRPLAAARAGEGVWAGLAGPTLVVNVLKCESLDDFWGRVVAALSPAPFLPSFGLAAPPTYDSVMGVLEAALRALPASTPLILFIEDINGLVTYPGWELAFLKLSTAVASNGNAIIVGNLSALLAYMNFVSLAHTGLRTGTFFFPSLPSGSEELTQFAEDGGHLFAVGRPDSDPAKTSLVSQVSLWNGNVQLIKHGTAMSIRAVSTRLRQCLECLALVNKPQWSHLITSACVESAATVLQLRAALLALLSEAPGHEVPILALPEKMHVLMIAEQLAAVDLVVFRTRRDPAGCEFDVVAPYHPVVVALFEQYASGEPRADAGEQAATISPPLAESCD